MAAAARRVFATPYRKGAPKPSSVDSAFAGRFLPELGGAPEAPPSFLLGEHLLTAGPQPAAPLLSCTLACVPTVSAPRRCPQGPGRNILRSEINGCRAKAHFARPNRRRPGSRQRGSIVPPPALSPSRGDQDLLDPGGAALGQAIMPGSPAPGDPGGERAQRAAAVAGVHRVERLHQQTGGSRRSRCSRSSCC